MALEGQGSGDESAAEQNPNDGLHKDDDEMGSQEVLELQEEQEQEEQEEQEERLDDDLLAIITVTMDHLDLENYVEMCMLWVSSLSQAIGKMESIYY